jgi:PII-like signaling protein
MLQEQPASLLRIHISEADRYLGKPLYEALVEKCRELKISGATVFRGLEGFGETAGMHKSHLTWHDQPVVIAIVDSAENIARLVAEAGKMMDTGVMAVSEVRAIRVQKHAE